MRRAGARRKRYVIRLSDRRNIFRRSGSRRAPRRSGGGRGDGYSGDVHKINPRAGDTQQRSGDRQRTERRRAERGAEQGAGQAERSRKYYGGKSYIHGWRLRGACRATGGAPRGVRRSVGAGGLCGAAGVDRGRRRRQRGRGRHAPPAITISAVRSAGTQSASRKCKN